MENPCFSVRLKFFATEPLRDLADPTEALALERLLNQGINPGNVADQFLWYRVADPQVGGAGRAP